MNSANIDVKTADGVADSYLTRPDDGRAHPGVLFMVDAFGLRPQIEAMADRIAAAGHVVLAPNVFYRVGRAPVVSLEGLDDPERRGEVFGRVMPLIRELTTERIVADGAAYLGRLEEEAGGGPIAITGYCMGGRLGWRIAAAYPERVAALACFHTGGLVTDDEDSPHLSAADIEAELYLGFADHDRSATPEQIAKVEDALRAAGKEFRAEVYAGAEHGYTMADTPAYDEAAAERAYEELTALLARTVDI
ncbi:MAG TPA: dienelactone hydrolase family protein [Solirubrobacterales bacterium]|nr:dienelactone hydrolase family protein [Solirubrobacterales bacterium]